jgi:hypothetical protein
MEDFHVWILTCVQLKRNSGPAKVEREKEDLMVENEHELFKLVEGLKQVDPHALADFDREMAEEAIPEIIREVEKRRMLAADSRQRRLEMPTDEKSESAGPDVSP